MPRIDFHSQVSDKLHYTCRLVRKARAANCQILVLTCDEQQLNALNERLWDFSATDFLPHVILGDPLTTQTPVILANKLTHPLPQYDLLINLTSDIPEDYARFNRVIEIVSIDEQDAQAGRVRFKKYQHLGVQPSHTVASST